MYCYSYTCQRLDGTVEEISADILNLLQLSESLNNIRISIAAYENPNVAADLQFAAFTLIKVEEIVDENWGTGQILQDNGKTIGIAGSFPLNYTQELHVSHFFVFRDYHEVKTTLLTI